MNEIPKDCCGRLIKLGDICVYPVRQGSKMWMSRMIVQQISHDPRGKPKISGPKSDGYPVTISAVDRITIVGRNNVIPFMED